MADKIINYEDLQKEYGEMTDMIIENFESTCFDQRMDGLLQGMLNKDWVAAMVNSHTLKGSAGYIKANPFIETVKTFQGFIKEHCENIKYPENEIATANRPQYRLKDEFDDDKKLQAYEYFHPIIEQARLLKLEMSKSTKSQVSENIFLAEGEKIRKMHDEFKQSIEMQRRQQSMRQSVKTIQTSQNQNNGSVQNGARPLTKTSSVLDNVALDPPQNSKCCDKCVIF